MMTAVRCYYPLTNRLTSTHESTTHLEDATALRRHFFDVTACLPPDRSGKSEIHRGQTESSVELDFGNCHDNSCAENESVESEDEKWKGKTLNLESRFSPNEDWGNGLLCGRVWIGRLIDFL